MTITPAVGRRGRSSAKDAVGEIDFLERPIRDETPEAYEPRKSRCAVRHREDLSNAVLPYIEPRSTYYRLDLCNVRRLSPSDEVAGCPAHYVD